MSNNEEEHVLCCDQLKVGEIRSLLSRYPLETQRVEAKQTIPGSYWGESEAGIINQTIYFRPDTPVHSLLHETCHVICMDQERRSQLHTDAGGETDEEDAVCYLQILLADELNGFGKARALLDMDRWGYSFRLGSAKKWFEQDAEDAREWLLHHRLIDESEQPTYQLRT